MSLAISLLLGGIVRGDHVCKAELSFLHSNIKAGKEPTVCPAEVVPTLSNIDFNTGLEISFGSLSELGLEFLPLLLFLDFDFSGL